MKIKNKKELILRARSNVREDELVNDFYAERVGGQKKARVCGIGCLSLPHRKAERIAAYLDPGYDYGNPVHETNKLAEDFGITGSLLTLLESLFVQINQAGGEKAAGEFINGFVKRLPEGANITRVNVQAFLGYAGVQYEWWPRSLHSEYRELEISRIIGANEVRDKLFAWLENGGRVRGLA